MRPLLPFLLLSAVLLAFAGCASTPAGFPPGKNGPKASSTTAPSECLARGKAAEERSDWGTAYRWYARGGGWNVKGRSTGFPGPGHLSEPQETQRFLCIAGFVEATRHLIAQGVRVDADGVHPLYVSLTEASQVIAYFRNVNPHGYAGLSTAQMATLQQQANAKLVAVEANPAAPGHAPASPRGATMDNLEQVDRAPSHLETFQSTMSASAERAAGEKRIGPGTEGSPAPRGDKLNLRQLPPISVPTEKHDTHAEAARAYRESAARYPEGDPRREEMLKLAGEEERQAARP